MLRLLLFSQSSDLGRCAPPAGFTLAIDSNWGRVSDSVAHNRCDVVLLDLECCPTDDRFGFYEELQRQDFPVVIITGDETRDAAVELLRRRVRNWCRKPLAIVEVGIAARWAHEYAITKRELAESQRRFEETSGCGQLVGSSDASQTVYELIRRVANLDVVVLVTGESGTGKELIARAIHAQSDRDQEPFVAVSCGAIPDSLIEAELFGCEKGAFTGAIARRAGYFEEAGRGTLFLDEIGELSLFTQVKLLRVLQQREFMRLGSSKAVPLQARVVFATNRNLKQMVAEGTFRSDLYYRLRVIEIWSVPLRDRPAEIPQLARHFLAKYARSYGKDIEHIDPHALELLRRFAWPGNIRELENVMQSAMILSDDDTIRASNLPEDLRQSDVKCPDDTLAWSSFEKQLQSYKVKLAIDAVRESHGNKTLAAQNLNISRTYLHRLIREPDDDTAPFKVA